MINVAARCLLIEDENRLVLIDCGMGNKQSDSFLVIITGGEIRGLNKDYLSMVFIKTT